MSTAATVTTATTLPNNNWTKNKENKLKEWQTQARLHAACHSKAQELFAKKNNQLLLPSIIMGSVAVFFDGAALLWEEQHFIMIMLALFITLISTILSGILQAMQPAEEASKHEAMSKGYHKIILQIDSMLTKEYSERLHGSRFLSKIEEELIALKTGGVKVPAGIWEKIKKNFLNGTLEFQIPVTDKSITLMSDLNSDLNLDLDSDLDSNLTSPFRSTTIPDTVTDPDQIPVTETDSETESEATSIIINREPLPNFELKIANDPVCKAIQNTMYDFQMSRFG
jgi:hypothetical protein